MFRLGATSTSEARMAPLSNDTNQSQASGNQSVNIQAGRNVVVQGMSATDVREIANLVFENNLPTLRDAAREEARANAKLFFDELTSQASNKLSEAERSKFGTADMQYALMHATIQA